MFTLAKPEPKVCELMPAQGDRPAVVVTFNPKPSPLSLRAARRAVAAILRDGQPNGMERAGDAFSAELIRHNIVSWSGIGDANDQPVEPTHDRDLFDDDGKVIGVEPGTITSFLAEPRLVEAADREYVLPWTKIDAEGNASAASASGTSGAATREAGTANKSARRAKPASGAKSARTGSTKRKPTGAKASGRSSGT